MQAENCLRSWLSVACAADHQHPGDAADLVGQGDRGKFGRKRSRLDSGSLETRAGHLAMTHPVSREWKGYWQRNG